MKLFSGPNVFSQRKPEYSISKKVFITQNHSTLLSFRVTCIAVVPSFLQFKLQTQIHLCSESLFGKFYFL